MTCSDPGSGVTVADLATSNQCNFHHKNTLKKQYVFIDRQFTGQKKVFTLGPTIKKYIKKTKTGLRPDEPPRALPPRDGVYVKSRFGAALGFSTF